MARPQTLAEVAQIARSRAADFAMALDEFTDEFYLDHPDKTTQQQRIDPVPEIVGDARIDAWIGAAGNTLHNVGDFVYRPGHSASRTSRWRPPFSCRTRARCAVSSSSKAHPRSARG
jgi:hypothetical protein